MQSRTVPIALNNMLCLLMSKKSFVAEEKRLLGRSLEELGVKREDFARIQAAWNERGHALLYGKDAEENAEIQSWMLAAAYFDNIVFPGERRVLLEFARKAGLPVARMEEFLAGSWSFSFDGAVADEAFDIRANLAAAPVAADTGNPVLAKAVPQGSVGSSAASPAGGSARPTAARQSRAPGGLAAYVATQVSPEGIDELQALYLSAQLNLNIALSGPPGVGKTESVLELGEILELPIFPKVCSSRTSESHLISHPVLMEKNGVSVTAHEDSALCRAMQAPGIFYGDEYNLLKEDVQKRMNSAFDDRRSIDRNDGSIVNARPGFLSVISYNPGNQLGMRDLEESVADRFVHFHFSDWPVELKAYISALKVEQRQGKLPPDFRRYGINLEDRGFTARGEFTVRVDGRWRYFLTGAPVEEVVPYTYHCIAKSHLGQPTPDAQTRLIKSSPQWYDEPALGTALAKFVGAVNDLATSGKSNYIKQLGLGDSSDLEDFELLKVHRCSTRIIASALMNYRWLVERQWHPYLAQSWATNLVINQMLYGSFRNETIRDVPNPTLVGSIAYSLALFSNNIQLNTDLKPSRPNNRTL